MSSSEPSPFLLQIIVASNQPGRVGLPVGEWVRDHVLEKGYQIDFADLAVINLPFMDEPKHPRLMQYEHKHTKDWSARVNAADGFIFVMPEYNHSFTAPLKNAIDFLFGEWRYKPVGFVSYGGVVGGTRAVQALKPSLTALKLTPLMEAVVITHVANFIDDESRFVATPALNTALDGMLAELTVVSNALKPLRAKP